MAIVMKAMKAMKAMKKEKTKKKAMAMKAMKKEKTKKKAMEKEKKKEPAMKTEHLVHDPIVYVTICDEDFEMQIRSSQCRAFKEWCVQEDFEITAFRCSGPGSRDISFE